MKYAVLIVFGALLGACFVSPVGNANQVHRVESPKYFPLPTQKEPDLVVLADEKDKLRPPEEGRPKPYPSSLFESALEKRVADLEAQVKALQGKGAPQATDAAACATGTCGTTAATADDTQAVGIGKGRIKKLIGRILHR